MKNLYRHSFSLLFLAGLAVLGLAFGCAAPHHDTSDGNGGSAQRDYPREDPFALRAFHTVTGTRWIGNAIAYGPYRDGQRPGGPRPGRAEILEDLRIMSEHWHLLRLYEAGGPTETILSAIRDEGIDMKVMLGIWIAPEARLNEQGAVIEALPDAKRSNRREIETGIRLAAAYPEIVLCVCVGNETQIYWSAHRAPEAQLIGYLREVRARTALPVTTADDFNFWNKPQSSQVAREVDFITMHYHPLWNGRQLEEALEWTKRRYGEVRAIHPDRPVIIGETGWATKRHTEGEQARLMKGAVGETEQAFYYRAVRAWARGKRITVFFFDAFDENWKGGDHPDEVEKHWGLFRADRTPKKAMADGG